MLSISWTNVVPGVRNGRRSVVPRAHLGKYSDPYTTLGLQPGASEHEVKRAYRSLVKQYHPDVSKGNTELQFFTITEAYEFLTQLARGKQGTNPDGSAKPANSDAFHDWYWSFKMSRTWEHQKKTSGRHTDSASAGAPPCSATSNVQNPETIRTQLAGLRHRAAIRKNRPSNPAATCGAVDPLTHQGSQEVFEGFAHENDFVVAEGPSDSADPPIVQSQAQPTHVSTSQGEGHTDMCHGQEDESSQQQDTTDGQQQHHYASGQKPKFVANSDVRESLKQQLHGMRRKAALKQKMYSS